MIRREILSKISAFTGARVEFSDTIKPQKGHNAVMVVYPEEILDADAIGLCLNREKVPYTVDYSSDSSMPGRTIKQANLHSEKHAWRTPLLHNKDYKVGYPVVFHITL